MFNHWNPFSKATGYKYLNGSKNEEGESLEYQPENPWTVKKDNTTSSRTFVLAFWAFILVLPSSIGFIVGQNIPYIFPTSDFLLAPAGTIKETWHYNQTFSRPPSEETEASWLSIFPRGRGFISHPSLSANISGIAVFHELHCLSGIRLAYYNALNKTYNHEATHSAVSEDAEVDAANIHNDPHHIRHCFDYLRHALMCAADTNLEPIDWKLGGSTGWGFERQCRNYDEVFAWAEKWRLHSQRIIA